MLERPADTVPHVMPESDALNVANAKIAAMNAEDERKEEEK